MNIFSVTKKRAFSLVMVLAFLGSILFSFSSVSAVSASTNSTVSTSPVLIAQATEPDVLDPDAEPAPEPTTEEAATCEQSGGLAWIFCPVVGGIYKILDWFSTQILGEGLLKIDTDSFSDTEGSLHGTWRFFLNIANLLFVIAFMVVIYAMATGPNSIFEAYSLQRMIPRMIFAVVMAHLSAVALVVLIDIFNDFGEGITQLMMAPVDGVSTFNMGELFGGFTDNSGEVAEAAGSTLDFLISSAVVIYAVPVLIALIGWSSLGVVALLGLAVLFAVLLLRYLILVLLFVIAPVAFATFVLPKTNRLFSMWWDSLWKLLLMYPMIMLLIASGRLAGTIISSGADNNFLIGIAGAIVTFLPFFIIPMTFKFAGQAMGAVTNSLQGWSSKQQDSRDPTSFKSRAKHADTQRRNLQITGRSDNTSRRFPLSMTDRQRSLIRRIPGVDADRAIAADVKEGRDIVGSLTTTTNDWVPTALVLTAGGRYKGSTVRTSEGNKQHEAWLKQGNNYIRDGDGRITTNDFGQAMINDGTMIRAAADFDFFDSGTMAAAKNLRSHRGVMQAAIEYTYGSAKSQQDINRVNEGVNAMSWTMGEKIGVFKGVSAQQKAGMLQLKAADPVGYFKDGAQKSSTGKQVPRMGIIAKKLANEMSGMKTYPLSQQEPMLWNDATQAIKQQKYIQTLDQNVNYGDIRDKLKIQKLDPASLNEFKTQMRGIGVRAGGLLDAVAAGDSYTIDPDSGDQIFIAGSQASSVSEQAAREFYETLISEMPELGLLTPEQMAALRSNRR